MYKVFFVDDENLVIKSLKASLNWGDLGFIPSGEANNGIDAYEKIMKLKPDLVFVDIRMPGMSGLELVKKIRQQNSEIQFIIISGHAEFAYAQKAMNYGSIGYCLKPFDELELEKMVIKAREKLDNKGKNNDIDFFSFIESLREGKEEYLEKLFKEIEFKDFSRNNIYVIISFGKEDILFLNDVKKFEFKAGVEKYAYFVVTNNEIIDKNSIYKSDDVESVGISRKIQSFSEIIKGMDEATIAAYQFFITGNKDIYSAYNINIESSRDFTKFKEALNKADFKEIEKQLNLALNNFKENKYNIKDAFVMFNLAVSYLEESDSEVQDEYLYNYSQLLDLFKSIEEMIDYLREILEDNIKNNQKYNTEMIQNVNMKVIIDYINKNFSEEISLQKVAEMFSLNSSYVSQLFRKETGTTFTKYLTTLRIDYACKCLVNSSDSINVIADKTGYKDYFYFSRVFKKVVNKTPSQYREENTKK